MKLAPRNDHPLERLDCKLQEIVIEQVRKTPNITSVDWFVVREQIASVLSDFGFLIPSAGESFDYWIENFVPSIDRDQGESG